MKKIMFGMLRAADNCTGNSVCRYDWKPREYRCLKHWIFFGAVCDADEISGRRTNEKQNGGPFRTASAAKIRPRREGGRRSGGPGEMRKKSARKSRARSSISRPNTGVRYSNNNNTSPSPGINEVLLYSELPYYTGLPTRMWDPAFDIARGCRASTPFNSLNWSVAKLSLSDIRTFNKTPRPPAFSFQLTGTVIHALNILCYFLYCDIAILGYEDKRQSQHTLIVSIVIMFRAIPTCRNWI